MKRTLSFFVPSVVLAGLAVACGGQSAPPPASPTTPTSGASVAAGASIDAELQASLAGAQRTEKEKARDKYRHPRETLEFFGLKDDMTVVEISPGGGWYTAVLAPVLRDHGKLLVVGGDPNGDPKAEGTQNARELEERFKKAPAAFDKVQPVLFKPATPFGPPESADMVSPSATSTTGPPGKETSDILGAAFRVLKHGGVLGLTDHRANPAARPTRRSSTPPGYVPEAYVIQVIEAAGSSWREVRDQRQREGHEGLPQGGVDPPADVRAGRRGPREVRGHRRE